MPEAFVQLTRRDGSDLWVNTRYIWSVEPASGGVARVELSDGSSDEYRVTDGVRSLIGLAADRPPRREADTRGRRDDRRQETRESGRPSSGGSGSYRWMREARFASACARCGASIYEGDPQLFDTETREVWCKRCVTRPGREAVPLPPEDADRDLDRAIDRDSDYGDDDGRDPFADDAVPSDREG